MDAAATAGGPITSLQMDRGEDGGERRASGSWVEQPEQKEDQMRAAKLAAKEQMKRDILERRRQAQGAAASGAAAADGGPGSRKTSLDM